MKFFYPLLFFGIATVQNLTAQFSAVTSSSNPFCTSNNGSASVTPSGGSNYTYKWSTNATTSSISNLGVGTYTVTVYSTTGGGATTWDSIYLETFDSTVQTWSINIPTDTNGNANNYWDISDSCIGNGAIGSCVNNTYNPPGGSNKCLYITAQPNGFGLPEYAGARYDAGGSFLGESLCDIGFCTATNMAAQSPNISTTGTHNLVLSFQYTAGGNGLIDNASLFYSIDGGTNFISLGSSLKSANNDSCHADGDAEGIWDYISFMLPQSCNNINNLVIRFNWTNDGVDACMCASDPSIAVDNVTLRDSIPGSGGTIDSIVKTVNLTARTAPVINLASLAVSKATCGQPNGAISDVSVTSGTSPCTYEWKNSTGTDVGDSLDVSGLSSGIYTLLVIDSAGCTADTTVDVQSSGGATIVTSGLRVTNPSCGRDNGAIKGITTSGGVAPVTIKWEDSTGAILNHVDTISGLSPGLYTFIASDSTGCSNDTSILLTGSGPAIAPTITPDIDTICPGDSAILCSSPQNYAHYAWSDNDNDTNACAHIPYVGIYDLTVTDINGCTAVAGLAQIAEYQVQGVTVSNSGDTLTCYPASSYQWYLNDTLIPGATSSVYIASVPGRYYVVITDNHGCSERSATFITGINEPANEIDFAVYPNPSTGNVRVLTAGAEGKTLVIYDAEGRMVLTTVIRSPQTNLLLGEFSPGIYICRLGNTVKMLVKE